MKYNKENYPELILASNQENLIGYLPADYEEVKCPKLIINDEMTLANFRGYYWTDMLLVGSNEGLVSESKNSELLEKPQEIVMSILFGLGLTNVKFNKSEIDIIEKWYKESLRFHCGQ